MEILFSTLLAILAVGTYLGMFWCVVGVPPGIIVLIIRLFKKFKLTRKILLIFFGGIPFLIIVFILVFLINMIATVLGINITGTKLPQI